MSGKRCRLREQDPAETLLFAFGGRRAAAGPHRHQSTSRIEQITITIGGVDLVGDRVRKRRLVAARSVSFNLARMSRVEPWCRRARSEATAGEAHENDSGPLRLTFQQHFPIQFAGRRRLQSMVRGHCMDITA